MFLGTVFEYLAQGFVLALVSSRPSVIPFEPNHRRRCQGTIRSSSKGRPVSLKRSPWLRRVRWECMSDSLSHIKHQMLTALSPSSAQMCIHTQATYKNGISNYMQVTLLALEEDWQMRSIWATSSVVWTIGVALFLWDRKQVSSVWPRRRAGSDHLIQKLQASTRQGACALPAFILSSALMAGTAASGVA
jgi:hypothetical protein